MVKDVVKPNSHPKNRAAIIANSYRQVTKRFTTCRVFSSAVSIPYFTEIVCYSPVGHDELNAIYRIRNSGMQVFSLKFSRRRKIFLPLKTKKTAVNRTVKNLMIFAQLVTAVSNR